MLQEQRAGELFVTSNEHQSKNTQSNKKIASKQQTLKIKSHTSHLGIGWTNEIRGYEN